MRRTRENSWQYVLFLVPAIAAGFGIQYLVKKHKGAPTSSTSVSVANSSSTTGAVGYREIAHEHHGHEDHRDFEGEDRAEDTSGTTAAKKTALTEDQDIPEKDLSKKVADTRDPASTSEAKIANDGDTCSSFELRGDGMSDTHFSNDEWTKVMDVFHLSKTDLQGWLVAHKSEFPGGLSNWMSQQIEDAKVQRPPVSDEPDLSWRGIGVLARTGTGSESTPLIRIGGGFVKMVVTQPKRARFELSRLLAQSWNPCDLPTGAMATWEPLLKCLNVKQSDWDTTKSCAAGSESEAGWAVASAVAATASPPGCTIPAFRNISASACVTKTAWLETPVDATVRVPASVNDIKDEQKTETAPATGGITMMGLAMGTTKSMGTRAPASVGTDSANTSANAPANTTEQKK